jgi:hypothetical protein
MDVQNVVSRQLGSTEFDQSASRVLHKVLKELFDPYHPERHYMRGPGPRWHRKHVLDQVAARRRLEQRSSSPHQQHGLSKNALSRAIAQEPKPPS